MAPRRTQNADRRMQNAESEIRIPHEADRRMRIPRLGTGHQALSSGHYVLAPYAENGDRDGAGIGGDGDGGDGGGGGDATSSNSTRLASAHSPNDTINSLVSQICSNLSTTAGSCLMSHMNCSWAMPYALLSPPGHGASARHVISAGHRGRTSAWDRTGRGNGRPGSCGGVVAVRTTHTAGH